MSDDAQSTGRHAETFIAFDNVRKAFGERVVLAGVTLAVGVGETVALIGPSGGGKSTLLRTINALCDFDAGAIQVGPHRLSPGRGGGQTEAVRQIRRLVGMVFQDFQLFPHLTALENIVEAPVHVAGWPREEAVATARRLLERVGLADRENAYPSQLSGGQKQRVAIARSLAMEPTCLLCDEITSALDPELKHEVLEVLDDLRRDGITLILVTHEIGFARGAANRVVVLCDGRILEEGPPAAVLDRPRHERTRQFLERTLA